MKLENLLRGVKINEIIGSTERNINDFQFDSREIKNNNLFIAISGTNLDGNKYISNAIDNGASVIVCNKIPKLVDDNVTYIRTLNLRA